MAGFVDYPKKKKSGKKQSHFVRDIDKESHEYFQRVLRDLENHDFQDEDDKGLPQHIIFDDCCNLFQLCLSFRNIHRKCLCAN